MDTTTLQPLLDWITQHPNWAGLIVFLIALTESLAIVGLFMPGVVLMFAIGALIATGNLDFWQTLLWAVAGAIAGDGISFWLGAYYKDQLRRLWPFNRYPKLFMRGERFFLDHGGKSILFGRFFGPVRPIIPAVAGMMGMSSLQFVAINLLSALLWAPAYLFPGMVFGASLELAAEVTTRLALLIITLCAVLFISTWLLKRSYQLLAPRTERISNRLLLWGRNHPHLGQITAALVDPQRPEIKGLTLLAIILVSLASLVLWLFQQFTVGPPLARLDSSSTHFLQNLRNPLGDHIMVAITQLSDGIVYAAIVISLSLWLLLKRHWLALAHLLAAAAFAVVATWLLQQALRPAELSATGIGLSTPSSHTVLAACLFGFLSIMIARELPQNKRWLSYAVAWLMIISIAFAQLYLGVHSFSNVIGSLLLGITWIMGLGSGYRRHLAAPISPSALIAIPALTLLFVGGWHISDSHQSSIQRYAPQQQTTIITPENWLSHGWQQLPIQRIDSRGIEMQPLNLQWAGQIAELERHLTALGWRKSQAFSANSALHWLKPEVTLDELPPLPHIHNGHYPALSMELPAQKLLLRLWPSTLEFGEENKLWQGYIGHQQLAQLNVITIPRVSSDFDMPMQQFKPFTALLNWKIKHRPPLPQSKWKGEVLILWSEQLRTTTN